MEARTLLSSAAAPPAAAPGSGPQDPRAAGDATVAGRYIFYNHSAFDGSDAEPGPADDFAVAPGIVPLLPERRASSANVSGYARGINGVMVDVDHLASDSLSSDDFDFRVGNTSADPGAWPAAPSPASITVRRGAGVNGTDRVTLVWPDGAVRNAWLRVSVLDTPDTGLVAPDVFAFGSLPGDTAIAPTDTDVGALTVNTRDLLASLRGAAGGRVVGVSSGLDHNRDGRVNARDLAVVRQNLNSRLERVQAPALPQVFYVSRSGDDANDGRGPGPLSAWRTAARVNATSVPPGSRVLFQRGGEWHEQLAVASSGTPGKPVVFGAYGAGPKPKFWGSDPLDPAAFEPVAGSVSTYRILPAGSAVVNSVQADHAFLIAASRAAGQAPPGAHYIRYVEATPNTWYQDPATGYVYVNTGGADPRDASVLYTASVRSNVVIVQGRHDVVVRDLVVDEAAVYSGGYAFNVVGSDDVTVERCEAYRAGKHHFGALNAGNFVGRDLYAAWAMPLQTYGECSAFVSYSDWNYWNTGRSSTWVNCTYDELPGSQAPYMTFYTHGMGMGDLTIENMTSRGGIGIGIATEGYNQRVRLTGGEILDGRLTIEGHDVFVDGVTLRGRGAGVSLVGSNNVVQNVLIDGAVPGGGGAGAFVNYGNNNTFRFSTVRVVPDAPWPGAGVSIMGGTGSRFYGNIIDAPRAFVVYSDPRAFESDHNLFAREPMFVTPDSLPHTLAYWRETFGHDRASPVADPLFADPAAGDLSLSQGSPAVDAFVATDVLKGAAADLAGVPRPQGAAFDLGAFERPA